MLFIIIGNIISFAAAIFTALSSLSKDTFKVYIFQMVQCLLLAIASIFFMSWSGIATLLICSFRNYLAAREKLSFQITVILLVLLVILGIFVNNRGLIGWIIIIATAIYTIGMYLVHNEIPIKINISINLILWIIYECFILDFSSLIMDLIALVLAVISIITTIKSSSKVASKS